MPGARAAALGLTDRLDLLPWQPASELAQTYRRTHVVLVPSRPTTTWVEQFGRVIVEAQASGSVVAGYASGAIPEVAGEPAMLTEVGAVAELGEGVAALVSDPAEYAERRAQGIELSSTRTWDAGRGPSSRSLSPSGRRRRSSLGAAALAPPATPARSDGVWAGCFDDCRREAVRVADSAPRRDGRGSGGGSSGRDGRALCPCNEHPPLIVGTSRNRKSHERRVPTETSSRTPGLSVGAPDRCSVL